MHINKLHIYVAVAIALTTMFDQIAAVKDGVQHCNDKLREIIQDSCKAINAAYKHRRDMYQTRSSIVKRENENESDDELDYRVEFLENETYEDIPKSHRLFNVRRSTFPDGAHLIVNHFNAKLLREFDPKYKIDPRPIVYRNDGGKLVKDTITTNRHKRNSHKRDISEKIAGCCNNDMACLMAMCVARH